MFQTQKDRIESLSSVAMLPAQEALAILPGKFPGKTIFSTSFSWEDQVITHLIAAQKSGIKLFTLDTGRLFEETLYVWNRTREQYDVEITAYHPDHTLLESFISEKGPNSFYESVENRKACCYIRKVEPLQRAIAGNELWITGLRAEHSPNRHDLPQIEWDENNNIIKYHPLLHWTTEELKAFIHSNGVPYNTLHDKGFVSIGCAPCTRAIREGEDFRAGRWWWEESANKECGLHTHS